MYCQICKERSAPSSPHLTPILHLPHKSHSPLQSGTISHSFSPQDQWDKITSARSRGNVTVIRSWESWGPRPNISGWWCLCEEMSALMTKWWQITMEISAGLLLDLIICFKIHSTVLHHSCCPSPTGRQLSAFFSWQFFKISGGQNVKKLKNDAGDKRISSYWEDEGRDWDNVLRLATCQNVRCQMSLLAKISLL